MQTRRAQGGPIPRSRVRLVVDTNVLVGELLRAAGRERLASEGLELFLPEPMWQEAMREIPRRAQRFGQAKGLAVDEIDALSNGCLVAIVRNCVIVPEAVYSALEVEARARSLRDADDWPVVACALALDAGVWTHDNDFLGTGVPTWTTETLKGWLGRAGSGD